MPDDAAECLVEIGRDLNKTFRIDRGTRLYQGAVGAVTVVRDDDSRYVVKLYRPRADRQAATELAALHRIRAHTSVPVPTPVHHGIAGGRPFLLMTYLPGARWADRRDQLSAADNLALAADSARLLGQLHVVTSALFGPLLQPDQDSAWGMVRRRCAALTAEYVARGGAAAIAARVDGLVQASRPAIDTCAAAVLCHNDFVDGNILIGEPATITGIVDLEAATWNDPLADVAHAAHLLRRHDPAAAAHLVESYGVTTPAAVSRLAVYETLHLVHQRNWIAYDRPAGWQQSIDDLDRQLRDFES